MNVSPFPLLEFRNEAWEGGDTFPAWAGLQSRGGTYTSRDGEGPSEGTARIDVAPPGGGEDRPSAEQAAAYAHLKANDAAIRGATLDAILEYARGLDPAYDLPRELDLAAIRDMVGLSYVHILAVAKDGLAYVGLELGCDWDEEHGCGVMTHAGRVVSVGGADESFENWIAERDGGTALA